MQFFGGIDMKKHVLLLFVLVAASAMLAIPYTAMGSINIPNAYVMPHLMMDFSTTGFMTSDGVVELSADETFADRKPYDELDYAGNLRIGFFNKVELGIVYTSTAGVFANFKFKLITETETYPAISFGMLNIMSEVGDPKENYFRGEYDYPDPIDYVKFSPFTVLSKSTVIVTGISGMDYLETTLHLGLGARRFRGRGKYSGYVNGLFGGLEIKPSKYWGVEGEIDGQDINLGLNVFFKNFTANACIFRLEDLANSALGNKLAINLKYTLDALSELKVNERRVKESTTRYMQNKTVPGSGSYYESGTNPLQEELEQIRQRRKQSEKELEEIRKLLQE